MTFARREQPRARALEVDRPEEVDPTEMAMLPAAIVALGGISICALVMWRRAGGDLLTRMRGGRVQRSRLLDTSASGVRSSTDSASEGVEVVEHL